MKETASKKVKPSGLELVDRLVGVQRVTKTTKGGRTFSFTAIVVVGDEGSIGGYGLGKSKEVSEAVTKGIEDAKKNLSTNSPFTKARCLMSKTVSSVELVYFFALLQAEQALLQAVPCAPY